MDDDERKEAETFGSAVGMGLLFLVLLAGPGYAGAVAQKKSFTFAVVPPSETPLKESSLTSETASFLSDFEMSYKQKPSNPFPTFVLQGASVDATIEFKVKAPEAPQTLDLVFSGRNGHSLEKCRSSSFENLEGGRFLATCAVYVDKAAPLGPRAVTASVSTDGQAYAGSSEQGYSVGFDPANCDPADPKTRCVRQNTMTEGESPPADLQSVVNAANAGDTIWIESGGWPIRTQLEINKPLTLAGELGGTFLVRDAGSTTRLIRVTASNVLISGLQLMNGNVDDGGALHATAAAGFLTLDHVTFTGNGFAANGGYAAKQGGAVFVAGASDVLIQGCTFDTNQASVYGGALYATGCANLGLIGNRFTSNLSDRWGGAVAIPNLAFCTARFRWNRYTQNRANSYGGAILSYQASGSFDVRNDTFDGNWAILGGGAIQMAPGPVGIGIRYSSFLNNRATQANTYSQGGYGGRAIMILAQVHQLSPFVEHNNFVQDPAYIPPSRPTGSGSDGAGQAEVVLGHNGGNFTGGRIYDNIFHNVVSSYWFRALTCTNAMAQACTLSQQAPANYNVIAMPIGAYFFPTPNYNTSANPLFADNSYLPLQPTSPAIGRASDGTNSGRWQ